uniref:Uncharacterized protein n=1 Tax=Oryza brachyantha TaxID=4533 RepID=J3MUF3_ORYBR
DGAPAPPPQLNWPWIVELHGSIHPLPGEFFEFFHFSYSDPRRLTEPLSLSLSLLVLGSHGHGTISRANNVLFHFYFFSSLFLEGLCEEEIVELFIGDEMGKGERSCKRKFPEILLLNYLSIVHHTALRFYRLKFLSSP